MADVDVNRADLMQAWAEPLEAWLRASPELGQSV
jgi:hypothetical protein